MRRLSVLLALTTFVLGATSICLLFRLRGERERVRADASELARQEAEIEALENERDDRERELRRLRRMAAAAGADDEPAAPEQEAALSTRVARRGAPAFGMPLGMEIPPAMRKMGALRTYGELARELKLSPAQTEQLIDLIVKYEDAQFAAAPGADADPALIERRLADQERKKEAAIEEVFGPEKVAQYRSYHDSLGQRMELRSIRDHLDVLGTPMSDEQRGKLLSILVEEKGRSPRPAVRQESFEHDLAQVQQWQADTQRRIAERAASVLDPEQRERLDEYYAMQASMSSMRMARAVPPADADD